MAALLFSSVTATACDRQTDMSTTDKAADAPASHPARAAPLPAAPSLGLPIVCVPGETCEIQNYVDHDPTSGSLDYRCGSLTYDGHSGLDIRLPDMAAQRRGVAVVAAASGVVARIRNDVPDISVKAEGAPSVEGQECGNGVVIDHGGGWSTQYCHMARQSIEVQPGQSVQTGSRLGLVGLSGNSEYPHLHFTVRRDAAVVDPFDATGGVTPGQCGTATATLWTDAAGDALAYQEGAVLNAGFSDSPVDVARLEEGQVAAPDRAAPALVAYVRAIGLRAGDRQTLTLRNPAGAVLAETTLDPLPRSQAQRFLYIGKRRPAGGWPPGLYRARYSVDRAGDPVVIHDFVVQLN